MTREKTREKWRGNMRDYERSGKSVARWCAEAGYPLSTFRYWRYKVRLHKECGDTPMKPVTWVSVAQGAGRVSEGMKVRIGEAVIELAPGFDPKLLKDIVRALS